MVNELKVQKKVFLVRHGQSGLNIKPVFQGADGQLSDVGRAQAQAVASRVEKLQFETIISSPFARAIETANLIGDHTGRPVEYCDYFSEMGVPSNLSEKSYKDEEAYELFLRWKDSVTHELAPVEDGETFASITTRTVKALEYLEQRKEQTLVVVTHGYFIRCLIAEVLFGDAITGALLRNVIEGLKTDNTGITLLTHGIKPSGDIGWRMRIFNDHAHLG